MRSIFGPVAKHGQRVLYVVIDGFIEHPAGQYKLQSLPDLQDESLIDDVLVLNRDDRQDVDHLVQDLLAGEVRLEQLHQLAHQPRVVGDQAVLGVDEDPVEDPEALYLGLLIVELNHHFLNE
jgi:hypothetical protein